MCSNDLGLLVSDSALLFPKGSLLCYPSGPVCFETGETGSYYVAQAALKLASLNLIIGVGGTFLLKPKRHPLSSRLVIQLQVAINSLKPPAQRRSGVEKTGFPLEAWVCGGRDSCWPRFWRPRSSKGGEIPSSWCWVCWVPQTSRLIRAFVSYTVEWGVAGGALGQVYS